MTYSKRRLYQLGEPLGDSATRREAGRVIYGGGGGGSSSSQANTTNTTQNTDMRVVGGNNSTNVSAQNSTVNVTDAGAVASAFGFANTVTQNAFDFAHASQIDTSKTVADALGQVQAAYSTAKAGEQKIFAGAALAIVGVVAAIAMRG